METNLLFVRGRRRRRRKCNLVLATAVSAAVCSAHNSWRIQMKAPPRI
jgi:hypothetical protein